MKVYFFNQRTIKFFRSLDRATQPPVLLCIDLLAKNGHLLGLPHSRALGAGLFELRIVDIVHIRFCYAFYEDAAWLLHGFVKKTETISKVDMRYAREQLRQLLQSI